jgi:ubiquinol-cytochrome c reductase cytochrome c1 subunit
MKTIHRILITATAAVAVGFPVAAWAAAKYKTPEEYTWSFEGPFGTYDRAQLQRGFTVYQQVCAACHGLEHLDFRHLGMAGGPFDQVQLPGEDYPTDFSSNPNENPVIRAIAAEYIVEDGPNEFGDMFERAGRPSDSFPYPFENEQQGRAANGGAYPPDLSVMVKARKGGPEYVRSLLLGYDYEIPADVEVRPGNYFNPYMSGQVIAMPPVLFEDGVFYEDGTPATVEQQAADITAFLAWAAEPHMEARKRMGLAVMIYLLLLCGLLYAAYRTLWSKVKH